MISKLVNMVKRAFVTTSLADDQVFPIIQISYHEKIANVEHMTPYGVYSNPPANALAIVLSIGGQEENRVAFANTPNSRFKNLKEGEVLVGNPLTGSYVKFDEDGNITELSKNNKTIQVDEDFNITVNGNTTINSTGNASINAENAAITATTLASITAPSIQLGNGSGGGPVSLAQFAALKAYVDAHVHSGVQAGGANTGAPTTPLPAAVGTTVVQGK